MDFFLHSPGIVCSLGSSPAEVRALLWASTAPCGLVSSDRYSPGHALPLGEVSVDLPATEGWPLEHRSRANALLAAALAPIRATVTAAIERFGPYRVGVVIGGSTSGVPEGERAVAFHAAHGHWPPDYDYRQQEMGAGARFLAWELGILGPAYFVSTACSSGPKALASAARMLNAGIVDAVVTGGADALSRFTVAGFGALGSLSAQRSRPLSMHRDGLNLGEGAALFLMTREPGPVRLSGWGESSDAHHMSAPDPSGAGAIRAMAEALQRAGIEAGAVDYLNLHGTGTPHNDAMESLAVSAVLGHEVAVSSTKPLTGHALGAAGSIEAAFVWLSLVDNPRGRLPGHWWDGARDSALPPLRIVEPGESLGRAPRHVMSNSFAFGGSNACVLLSAA
jgi:3-oxoacyl-[acyl-carrier-protein] synthase I